jgi:two-component system, LuxR family, response regulator FixJ
MNKVDGNHVILLVDDDSGARDSLKFMLEVEGFRVHAYATAHELLDENTFPDVSCLVTDYRMPGMNGLELIARLRDRRLMMPAILITALPDEDLRRRAAAAEISLIEKPVLGSRLLDAIRGTLDQSMKPPS